MEVATLGDCCEVVMGQSPKSEFYNENGEGLPFHEGVTNFGDHFPIDKVYLTITERIAEAGDILFSVRAPVGRINRALHRLVIGRGCCCHLRAIITNTSASAQGNLLRGGFDGQRSDLQSCHEG